MKSAKELADEVFERMHLVVTPEVSEIVEIVLRDALLDRHKSGMTEAAEKNDSIAAADGNCSSALRDASEQIRAARDAKASL